ncbi:MULTISPECIES: TlpA family protein disulfide reductase [Helicobacter]|uniref:TlpA disulfide reductase family protein n=1 Tax=Helicobacter ibis TaxID=2962633 RepID=A0ABT4VFH2_9HELI|nr:MULTISPECIES: TlpA disulfide reductase family protein [Helicobacter]MDA3967735.1 TlpA disulfide reductase family protein [Helicobacter sp. WB40]MDA3969454.1 TlpA disulfide reductase family protein [Helicobacter ibis]
MKLIVMLFMIFMIVGCDTRKDIDDAQIKSEKLINLTLSANNGEKVEIKQIQATSDNLLENLEVKGSSEIVLLFFFTTWCEPCLGVMPHMERLSMQFDNKVKIYGIPIDDFVGEIENFESSVMLFVNSNEIKMPIIVDNFRLELLEYLQNIEGIPLLALYDNGSYVIDYLGAIPEEMLEFDITQLLNKDNQG